MARPFISIKFNEASLAKLRANLIKLDLNTKQGAKKAVTAVARNIMAQSQSEVPRDTETLRDTSYIKEVETSGNKVSINLGYASPETDKQNPESGEMASAYAMVVHETSEWKHPYGKYKYLEEPARAHQGDLVDELGRELRIVYARGVKGGTSGTSGTSSSNSSWVNRYATNSASINKDLAASMHESEMKARYG